MGVPTCILAATVAIWAETSNSRPNNVVFGGKNIFEGFTRHRIDADGIGINLVTAGGGPPLLLLHGYPQSHVTWHKVAPVLAARFTVVVPDLRGYGDSDTPPGDAAAYAKRVMATDQVRVMAALGHDRFNLAGHDRGGRVAYRLALDYPERVIRLATLDIIPTLEQFERMGKGGSHGSFHWFFLAQPAPFPETLIGADPAYFLRHMVDSWCGTPGAISDEAMAAYVGAFRNPAVIRATCDDYRAGIGIDCDIDRADRTAGKRIECPLLALWGARGRPHKADGVLEVWRNWASDVRGAGIDCGHFLPEEAPAETAEALRSFLAE